MILYHVGLWGPFKMETIACCLEICRLRGGRDSPRFCDPARMATSGQEGRKSQWRDRDQSERHHRTIVLTDSKATVATCTLEGVVPPALSSN